MKRFSAAVALLFTAGFNTSAFAEATSGNTQVNILSAITFNENQVVDFKFIPADNGVCTMAASGVLSGQCAGQPDGTPGQFTISGTPSQAITISVGAGSTSGGVTYNPTLAANGLTTGTATLSSSGSALVSVVGSLNLASATPGTKALTYTITVEYQ